jgi:hypothetical protein
MKFQNRKIIFNIYIKNFETGNIKYTNEILSFSFNIECYIDTLDQPAKHTIIELRKQISDIYIQLIVCF